MCDLKCKNLYNVKEYYQFKNDYKLYNNPTHK